MSRGLALSSAIAGSAMLLAFFPAARPAPAEDKAAAPTVHIGLVSSLFPGAPEPMIQLMAKPFQTLMEDQAGFVSKVVVGGNAAKLADLLKTDKVQLGVFNGFEFAWARANNPNLQPLMIAVNRQPFVRVLLVVNAENKAANTTALQGKILAVPKLAHAPARIFAERRCSRPGMPMDKWFAAIATPSTAQDALDDVAGGLVQAAVVEDVELAAFRKEYPKTAAKLRVLEESETFPCAVIAYQADGMDKAMLKRLLEGMIAAKDTVRGRKLLELCRITGFEAIPANYEQNLSDILKAYPPPK